MFLLLNYIKKMNIQFIQSIFLYFLVYAVGLEFEVYGEIDKEMLNQGRAQYLLIRERGTLPKYGSCWKSALEHLDEGCRQLSEDTQSDMALHITNCFLEMSGLETYNCELDKKPNLRGICISSMSDKAFNVYTEFYTHTQNICWFLRGQIWHETIAENTWKVGKQLEQSAETQNSLLEAQKSSLEMQEKMMKHGQFLEKVLEDLYVSTKSHQEIIRVLAQTVTSLQTWVVGEISWIDSILFYMTLLFFIFVITSTNRTIPSRLVLCFMLFLNFIVERSICSLFITYSSELYTDNLYNNIYRAVWYSRYIFCTLGVVILVYRASVFKDVATQNNELLSIIQNQNHTIQSILEKMYYGNNVKDNSYLKIVDENLDKSKTNKSWCKDTSYNSSSEYLNKSYNKLYKILGKTVDIERETESEEHNLLNGTVNSCLPSLSGINNIRYNLRSRTGTPDSGVN